MGYKVELIRRSVATNAELYGLCRSLEIKETEVLSGWPYDYITLRNFWDIVSVYNELGLQQVIPDGEEMRRWNIAGNIVARIERDNRER